MLKICRRPIGARSCGNESDGSQHVAVLVVGMIVGIGHGLGCLKVPISSLIDASTFVV
jgi:hypothetical protein